MVGVKVTLTVQDALAAMLAGQLLAEIAKSPEVVMEVIETACVPLLVTVMFCTVLVVPTVCAGKVSEVGLNVRDVVCRL